MGELSTEQVLLLNQLMYMGSTENGYNPMGSVDQHVGGTVGDWIKNVEMTEISDGKDYGSFITGKDWKNIITAIQNDPEICSMRIVASHEDWAEGGGGGLSAIFTNESSGEAVVAFRGTAGSEWKDNFLGGNVTDTPQQQNALNWYRDAYQEYGLDRYSVTVTGHSKGGNKCKYITVMDSTVDRCLSYDGQGYSDKFMEAYADKIAANQWKIQNHNVDGDYVNILLNDIGETTYYKGYDLGKGGFLENHCPNTFMKFGENGEWSMVVNPHGQDPKMAQLNEFFNSYLRSMPDAQRSEALELFGLLADGGLGDYSGLEKLDRILSTLGDSKYADDLAYFLAYALEYAQREPDFLERLRDFFDQAGMGDLNQLLDYAEHAHDFLVGSELQLWRLSQWLQKKLGIDLLPLPLLYKLRVILGLVVAFRKDIKICDDRQDRRVASTGGPGRKILCDPDALQRVSSELKQIRTGLANTAQSVKSAMTISLRIPGMGRIQVTVGKTASRIERLEASAGQLAAALEELGALYRETEAQNLSSADV